LENHIFKKFGAKRGGFGGGYHGEKKRKKGSLVAKARCLKKKKIEQGGWEVKRKKPGPREVTPETLMVLFGGGIWTKRKRPREKKHVTMKPVKMGVGPKLVWKMDGRDVCLQ